MNSAATLRADETISDAERLAGDARLALRRLASSVSVVSCHALGASHAMTATSVSALSMDPPSMLVCVNRSARFHAAIDAAETFAINILGRHQAEVSRACSGAARGEERFAAGRWDHSGAAPILSGAQANLVCRREQAVDYGTHTIFMGRILSVALAGGVDPLIYLNGAYGGRPLEGSAVTEITDDWYLL